MDNSALKHTLRSELPIRVLLEIGYALIAFLALVWLYKGSTFCNHTSKFGFIAPVLKLGLFVIILDLIASLCSRAFDRFVMPKVSSEFIAPVICCAIVGLATLYLPCWIGLGYGHFRFENTFADVSCLFTEGYGMAFPFVFAPLFAVLSLIREWLLEKTLRCKVRNR